MKIGFAGAGKVGFSLGKMFVAKGLHVTGYYNRHVERAIEAAKFTKTECFEELSQLVENSDTIILTVSDDAIQSVYEQLKSYNIAGKQICHVSGLHAAKDVFPDIEKIGAFGFSVHPLFPISDCYKSFEDLMGAFFCLEGHDQTVNEWKELFDSIGLKTKIIDEKFKSRYHAACVFSSNLVCGLIETGTELLESVGFSKEDALVALTPLIKANIENITANGPTLALTGPVERGDVNTVKKHLRCLTDDEKRMYIDISKKLVKMSEIKNPQRNYEVLTKYFEEGQML